MSSETRVKRGEGRSISGGQVSLISPWLHPLGVKREIDGKDINRRRNNNSLFFFLPFTPTPSRNAHTRVCVYVRGVMSELRNRQWFLPGGFSQETPAGTAALLSTVCFDCPNRFRSTEV